MDAPDLRRERLGLKVGCWMGVVIGGGLAVLAVIGLVLDEDGAGGLMGTAGMMLSLTAILYSSARTALEKLDAWK